MTLWFDVEDLVQFIASGHTRTSGIQRVGLEIYRAAIATGHPIGFVRHQPGPDLFQIVPHPTIATLFADQAAPTPNQRTTNQPKPHPTKPTRSRLTRRLPEEIRAPLLAGAASQAQALAHLAQLATTLLTAPARAATKTLRRTQPPTPAHRFNDLAKPGDTLLVLGSPWARLYSPTARILRGEHRMKFGVLVHDLVPIRHPEWVDQGVRRVFEPWYVDILPHCDIVLANSRHTAADVETFIRDRALNHPNPVQVLPMGTTFTPTTPTQPDTDYVLVVATLEARKNHTLAVNLWSKLLEAERTGARPKNSTPDLVFAGRTGWLVADLLQQLDRTDWLEGRIRLAEAPTDAALQTLYANSRFTLVPSLYEGWGLPVTESLALGKPCLCSNAAALPEAGGRFCRYFDPDDLDDAYRTLTATLDDPAGLEAWAAEIRRDHRPTEWAKTATRLLELIAAQ